MNGDDTAETEGDDDDALTLDLLLLYSFDHLFLLD